MSSKAKIVNFIIFFFVIHEVFSDSVATADEELYNQNSDSGSSGVGRMKQLLNNIVSNKVKRSPQWHQSLLVQGLSRPFCNLFGGNTGCTPNPASNVQSNPTQCAIGYRYDYATQRCRQIQYGK
ncbi:hypothetical protein HNY73_013715 [Argiope bruennichi]|uniref:Uncharacterized protein n=1 Tax=Argiope bruennichi TaxID=94029 RepID=A0A8T0ERX4_ARGBR|nr:hypothetical protein HNY73_013715 [Argiope bruennichi]